MIKKKDISQTDNEIWNNYLKNPTDVYDKDKDYEKNLPKNLRFKYDLHGYSLENANKKVRESILSCSERNFSEILLITGKGIHSNSEEDVYISKNLSKLKFSVPEYINSRPDLSKLIISISTANKSEGGDGALVIKLKKL